MRIFVMRALRLRPSSLSELDGFQCRTLLYKATYKHIFLPPRIFRKLRKNCLIIKHYTFHQGQSNPSRHRRRAEDGQDQRDYVQRSRKNDYQRYDRANTKWKFNLPTHWHNPEKSIGSF
jgi:hypothetical protein